MTLSEAISVLESIDAKTDYFLINDDSRAEAIDMAISALEKQIPKKHDMIQTDYDANIWHLYCPSCKDWIGTWNGRLKRMDMRNILNGNICPYCGQAIDWTGGVMNEWL